MSILSQPMLEHTMMSCGVYQLYNLESAENDLRSLATSVTRKYIALVIWSDIAGYSKRNPSPGEALARAVLEHKLGEITESPRSKNLNSGNWIRVWVFKPDTKACKAFIKEHGSK